MMKLTTEVDIPKSTWNIRHDEALLLLGSCFADNMGERLKRAGFCTESNPLGTLYNPVSVAETLMRLMDEQPFSIEELHDFGAEGWGSWMAHSLLSRPTPDEALTTINKHLAAGAAQLRRARVLIVTFGTAWVYRLKSGEIITNCHRQPEKMFIRERLTVDDVVRLWQPLLQRLNKELPSLHVLFTVSPIRHLRDGAHANQLSKATLLLAVEELIKNLSPLTPNLAYFPAYEIVLDELRDYRFYADDMTHPSPLAIDYLWQRFADTFFDASTRDSVHRIEEITKALEHRPLHPESDEYRRFLRQTLLKIEEIQKEFPYFETRKLIDQCHTLLNS